MMHRVALSPLVLHPGGGIARTPPRPPHLREPDYDERFDFDTIFYDVFRSANGRWVVCVGPPLTNLEALVAPALARAFGVVSPRDIRVRSFDRHDQIWLRTPADSGDLPPGLCKQDRVAVQSNGHNLFDGKRVLVTMSRNNQLAWIRDWATFHASAHGCDAVLFYDNASGAYSQSDIVETLATVAGVDTAVVIDWPFKFGPLGSPSHPWDSDYSQRGALEHARHRFLGRARAVLNVDIDELVITADGSSIFDLVCRSDTGYLNFPGHCIENVTASPGDFALRRHRHFFMVKSPPAPAQQKWAVVPWRCPMRSQWSVHHVTRLRPGTAGSAAVHYCHFEAITDNWRYQRFRPEAANPFAHFPDQELLRWMQVFDAHDSGSHHQILTEAKS